MIEFPPIEVLITTGDTQWALAAKVPVAVLDAARGELSDFLQGEGSRVVRGNKGMSVLLVFGGSVGEGDDLAEELTRKHQTSVFLLEFGDWASIKQFDGARVTRRKGHPAKFLDSYGVMAPGYEPGAMYVPPITVIGVVEGVTLEQVRRVMPKKKEHFVACARGVLVHGVSSIVTLKLSQKLKRRSFTLYYDREDGSFSCIVWISNQHEECFSDGMEFVNYKQIDSILGETTLDGILRVLDIPRHLLYPDGATATAPPSGQE
jgi:hypothetical protein